MLCSDGDNEHEKEDTSTGKGGFAVEKIYLVMERKVKV